MHVLLIILFDILEKSIRAVVCKIRPATKPREDLMELIKAITGRQEYTKIGIHTAKSGYCQSEEITGEVRISAPGHALGGEAVILELREYWTETRLKEEYNYRSDSFRKSGVIKTESCVLSANTLSGPFSLEPRTVRAFPFKIRLPRNCRFTMRTSGMRLAAAVKGPDADIPAVTRKISVLPAKEFLAILKTFEENMGFKENKRHRVWEPKFLWNTQSPSTYFRLTPPLPMNLRVKHVGLDLLQSEGFGVKGNLLIKPRKKSVYDIVKGALSLNISRKPFFLNPSQVLLPDGRPNRKAIVATIGSLIW